MFQFAEHILINLNEKCLIILMKLKLLDINFEQPDTFNFNPSIGHIVNDIYLISSRNVRTTEKLKSLDNEPNLHKNVDHPWKTNWNSKFDNTSLQLFKITNNKVSLIKHSKYPFILAYLQDLRIFELWSDNDYAAFILSFNQLFLDNNLVLKDGYECSKRCFIINTGFLVINKHTLEPFYIPSKDPLCINISNPIEKNWSFWKYKNNVIFSYNLTPTHEAFKINIRGIEKGELVISDKCRLLTFNNTITTDNFLQKLEQYYDGKVIVSLSAPSYKINNEYYSVGHIKIFVDYLKRTAKPHLKNFYNKHIKGNSQYLHKQYIYLMFFYKFNVSEIYISDSDLPEINSDVQTLVKISKIKAIKANITGVSYCYVFNTTKYNYLLNFPSGFCINNNRVYISFGEADKSSHLLSFSIQEFKKCIKNVSDLTPSKYKFVVKSL